MYCGSIVSQREREREIEREEGRENSIPVGMKRLALIPLILLENLFLEKTENLYSSQFL